MPLPPSWQRFVDAEGDAYYYNDTLKQSAWLLFWELKDDEGNSYYMDCETKQCQWEKPGPDAVIVLCEPS